MKKIIISLLSVLFCVSFLFAGCGKFTYENEYVKLGKYKGLKTSSTEVTVKDEDVATQISQILSSQTIKTPVTDRDTVKEGDTANIDYKGSINGVAFEGGTATGADLVIGSGQFIPGFEDQLIGAKVGETRDINVTFPEEYHSEELAGKDAVFSVKINSISISSTPELTDEFVQTISNGQVDTIEGYKVYIKENLEASKKQEAVYNKQNNIWMQIVDNSEIINYPEDVLQKRVEQSLKYYEDLATSNEMSLEEYLSGYYDSVDAFKQMLTTNIQQMLQQELLVNAIAEAEKITISDEEYQKGLEGYAAQYGFNDTVAFENQYNKEEIVQSLTNEKVMAMLEKSAKEVEGFTYDFKSIPLDDAEESK